MSNLLIGAVAVLAKNTTRPFKWKEKTYALNLFKTMIKVKVVPKAKKAK